MKRSWLLSLLVAAALVSLNMPAFAQSDSMEDLNSAVGALTNRVNTLEKKGPSIEIHGFVQQDIINDSTQSFNETVGDGGVKQAGTVAGDNGWTQFSERNSRIDFLGKMNVNGWDTKGYLEMDLLGFDGTLGYAGAAGTVNEAHFYNQPDLRLRHAYLEASNDGWDILAGQYWSLFGWNMDYVLATVSEAPTMSSLYFRTPQLRITKTFGDDKGMQFQVAVDAEKPDEVASQVPNLNAGIRFTLNDVKGQFCQATGGQKLMPLSVGLGIRNSNVVWNSNVEGSAGAGTAGQNFNNNQNMWGSAVAADVLLPVVPVGEGKDDISVVLTGEWTAGAGDTDGFNGGGFTGLSAIASSVTANTANIDGGIIGYNNLNQVTMVQIQSLNAQIQLSLPKSIGTLFTFGYGEIFSPNASGLQSAPGAGIGAGTFNDDRVLFANVMQDFTPNIRVGLEVATFDTHYVNAFGASTVNFPLYDAVDNRCQLSTWYRF